MSHFEITYKDSAGRIGRLHTAHGRIETPTVMPVVNPNIQMIPASELVKFGAEIVITNAYIIYQNPELKRHALDKGVHSLLGFDGAIMTDSGSYQLSVYHDIDISSEEIVRFQQMIGSDIGVPLDIPTPPDVSRERAGSEMKMTIERCKAAHRLMDSDGTAGSMLLAGTVQGSTHPDLRYECARFLSETGFDIYPVGAVVPLLVNYRFADMVDVIVASKKGLSPAAPVHLFGAGHPAMFALAVALGCDLFDSAAYALYARDGRYLTADGTYHLANLRYLPCSCPVCASHTADELRSEFVSGDYRSLAEHNLYATFEEIRLIKQCIIEGNLWELVERRCRAHPRLLDGLKRAIHHTDWVEKFDPIRKSTFFYCGGESASRAEVCRFGERLDRFDLGGTVLVRTRKVGGEANQFDCVLNLKAPFGAYPVELGETYPFNAEVPELSEPDYEAASVALGNTLRLIRQNPDARFTVVCEWNHPLLAEIGDCPNVEGLLSGNE
ncbi:MAG: tRNA-guanine(15) transglycosylase [Candidatus Methanogaster sp.]|nr:MAG: tRNA-guanine(15) transglycosylase [ANME-2 cluster archaeon]